MAKSNFLFSALFFVVSVSVHAQTNRYVVFFKDKANSVYSVSNPLQFLSQRAIDRRAKNNVSTTEVDLPVNSNYVTAIKSAGALVMFKSKWFNAVLVQCDQSLVPTLENIASVSKVEFVAPGIQPIGRTRASSLRTRHINWSGSKTFTQLNMLGIDALHQLGVKGEGIKVAVFDAGFPSVNTIEAFTHLQDNILDTYDFVHNQQNVYAQDDHGTEVLSAMAGLMDSTFVGGAYNADYHLYITEHAPTEYRIEEYNWLFAAERADSIGVDVINASLGYNLFDDATMDYTKTQLDGQTAVITRAAQAAADRGMFVVVSAGNDGNTAWQLINPPADAAGVIAAGSVTSSKTKSPFSSIGPTTDNRIKPDLCAMGSGTSVIRENGSIGTASGTSLSSPVLASLITCLAQRFNTLTKDELVAALKISASHGSNPNFSLGFGIPHFEAFQNYIDSITESEKPTNDAFTVFPNPVDSGIVHIKPTTVQESKPVLVVLYTTTGRLIKEYTFTFDWLVTQANIDMHDLPAGVLLIQIKSQNRTDIFKIVNVH